MIHELGHFLAAKHGGMKVTEYFVGFGPRLWSFRRGETEYGIKALPLGGYVKIPGMTNLEEVDPADEGRLYRDKPFHARLLVAVAGSAMHFLMAFLLLWALLSSSGCPTPTRCRFQGVLPVGGRPGPAAGGRGASRGRGGVGGWEGGRRQRRRPDHAIQRPPRRAGDRGRRPGRAAQDPDRHPGQRADHPREGDGGRPRVRPRSASSGSAWVQPTQRTAPLPAVGSAGAELGHFMWASVVGVGHLFSPNGIAQRFNQVTSAKAADQAEANGTRPLSVVGVVQTATDAAQAGIGQFLCILIIINVFFGIFNLFPMLPLDGGHVAIAVYEKIRTGRRRVMYHADVAKLMPFTWLMLMFLAILVVPALLTDILHPVANPFG